MNTTQSYDYYCSLIRSGNSVDFITAPISTMYGEIMLERAGQADFGLGYYQGNGHSSGGFVGKFGDGTVADSLNGDFLDYLQNNSYTGNDCTVYLSNGNYCKISYLVKAPLINPSMYWA